MYPDRSAKSNLDAGAVKNYAIKNYFSMAFLTGKTQDFSYVLGQPHVVE